jgi:hypothetical protein
MKRRLDRSESVNFAISKVAGIFNRGVEQSNEPVNIMEFVMNQEVFIPMEVLLEIFKFLRRLDVEKMKSVCKYWAQAARHPSLGFRLAHKYCIYDTYFYDNYKHDWYNRNQLTDADKNKYSDIAKKMGVCS